MSVTTFEGIVKNGQIRLPANVRLPENAKVYVVVPNVETPKPAYIGTPRLVHPEQAADFKKEILKDTTDAELR
jgi:hypothetical protein